MIELLTTDLLWWHWIILGIFLLTLEIFTGTFMLLGFGLSAMIVGILDNFLEINIITELILWIIFSILSLILWFKYFKEPLKEYSGQSNYSLNIEGIVTKEIKKNQRGEVTFDAPVLGNTVWTTTSKETLTLENRVKIIKIKGQLIEVAKI